MKVFVPQEVSLNVFSAYTAWTGATTYTLYEKCSNGGRDYESKSAGNLNHAPAVGGNAYWHDLGVSNYTSIAETGSAYNAGTTYAEGQTCTYGHKDYISLAAGNIGHAPNFNPEFWQDEGYVNRFKMFDNGVSTQTVGFDEIALQIPTDYQSNVNTVVLLNVDAYSVTLKVDAVGEAPFATRENVYDETRSLVMPTVSDWYEYFFDPLTFRKNVVFGNLPVYPRTRITLILEKSGGLPVIGKMAFGAALRLGADEWGARAGISDYSSKTKDAWGNYTITERVYSDLLSTTLVVDNAMVDVVKQRLAAIRATPSIFIGDGDFDVMAAFGFPQHFDILLQSPAGSICSLEIEGLI